MAWKNYSQMTPEEKKASWSKFRENYSKKKQIASRMSKEPQHPSDHKLEYNPGGYCKHCSYGRDHS